MKLEKLLTKDTKQTFKMNKLKLLFLLITISVKSQTTVKTYYDPLFKTKIKEVYQVKPNSPTLHGKYTSYDQYGNKLKVCYYKNNLQHGQSTKYYGADEASILPDKIKNQNFKKISGIYNYSNGNLNGNQTQYIYDSKGIKHTKIEKKFDNGKEIYSIEYYLNNQIKKKQQINGLCFTNNENGKRTEEWNLTNNEYNGKYSSFYDNGNIYVNGNYVNGNRIGKWIENFKNGKLKTENIYEGDLLVQQKTNFSNGKLKWEMKKINEQNYIENTYDSLSNKLIVTQEFKLFGTTKMKHGVKKTYAPKTESITKIENFRQGENTFELTEFYENNSKKREIKKTSNGNFYETTYYTSGQLKSYLTLIRDNRRSSKLIKNGEAFYYFENKKIKETGKYNYNKKEGEWKYYDNDGNLTFIETENKLSYKREKKSVVQIQKEAYSKFIKKNSLKFNEQKLQVDKLYTIEDKLQSKILGQPVYKKDKKYLFKAYQLLLSEIEFNLKSPDLKKQKESIELGLTLTSKMTSLKALNTKKLEKSLKKVTNTTEIKKIIGI